MSNIYVYTSVLACTCATHATHINLTIQSYICMYNSDNVNTNNIIFMIYNSVKIIHEKEYNLSC